MFNFLENLKNIVNTSYPLVLEDDLVELVKLSLAIEELFALVSALRPVELLRHHSPIAAGRAKTGLHDLDFVLGPRSAGASGAGSRGRRRARVGVLVLRLDGGHRDSVRHLSNLPVQAVEAGSTALLSTLDNFCKIVYCIK